MGLVWSLESTKGGPRSGLLSVAEMVVQRWIPRGASRRPSANRIDDGSCSTVQLDNTKLACMGSVWSLESTKGGPRSGLSSVTEILAQR